LQVEVPNVSPPACGETALDQATKGADHGPRSIPERHMAVATRQKSTARRLVSICTVLEGTYPMVFSREAAVTTGFVRMSPIVV
jgi:hypothetical protein